MKKIILLLAIAFYAAPLVAQEDALVFFADKENVAAALANPLTILTQEAIDRKQLHNTPIDARDVPVNENYITQIKNTPNITVLAKSKWMNSVYVRGNKIAIENLVNDFPFVTEVEFADKSLNFHGGSTNTPNDKFALENETSRFNFDYGAAENQVEMISADFLHDLDFAGEGMIVAVLDSGFPGILTNPAFEHVIDDNRLLDTYNFVTRQSNIIGSGSHGLNTASDIAGFLDGDFVGTAPQATFVFYVTEEGGAETPAEEAYWVEALERADSLGVDVVNTSLGYQDFDNPAYDHEYEDLDGVTTIGARGANLAFEKGMLLVTSGGNDGNGFGYVATPGDAIGMLTVGAVDANENYVSFSSYGPTFDGRVKPDVMAQGANAAIITTNGNVSFANGTSFSAPIMAGAVTSLWQSRPEATNAQVMDAVREASHLFNNPTDEMGYGIPDFQQAYNALQLLGNQTFLAATQFGIYPNPAIDTVTFNFPEGITKATVHFYSITGRLLFTSEILSTDATLGISQLPKGMYLATVTAENKSNTFKVIKQ